MPKLLLQRRASHPARPVHKVHPNDNVATIVNDGGSPAGTAFPGEFVLRDGVPQGHKVALRDFAAGDPVVRYGVVIGHALRDVAQGSWIREFMLDLRARRFCRVSGLKTE
jgi:galactarate dehydratase